MGTGRPQHLRGPIGTAHGRPQQLLGQGMASLPIKPLLSPGHVQGGETPSGGGESPKPFPSPAFCIPVAPLPHPTQLRLATMAPSCRVTGAGCAASAPSPAPTFPAGSQGGKIHPCKNKIHPSSHQLRRRTMSGGCSPRHAPDRLSRRCTRIFSWHWVGRKGVRRCHLGVLTALGAAPKGWPASPWGCPKAVGTGCGCGRTTQLLHAGKVGADDAGTGVRLIPAWPGAPRGEKPLWEIRIPWTHRCVFSLPRPCTGYPQPPEVIFQEVLAHLLSPCCLRMLRAIAHKAGASPVQPLLKGSGSHLGLLNPPAMEATQQTSSRRR